MYRYQELKELEKLELMNLNRMSLRELSEIKISQNGTIEEKLSSFLEQIKNPYCFLVNGTAVQISFHNHNQSLEDCLTHYLIDKKNADNIII